MDTNPRAVHTLAIRDLLQTQRNVQTEREGMEKIIPLKWESKKNWTSNTHIGQINFKRETYHRQRRTIHNNDRMTPRTIVNIYPTKIGAL